MAKVGLENDTLKPPKCPSNWEYSTGQRQLLDIQSREQMDRLSFSAQRRERQPIGCLFSLKVRGFERATPSRPFQGLGGVNIIREKCPQRGLESRFTLRIKSQSFLRLFCFYAKRLPQLFNTSLKEVPRTLSKRDFPPSF